MKTLTRASAALAGAAFALGATMTVPASATSAAETRNGGLETVELTSGDISILEEGGGAAGGWIAYTGEGRVTVRDKPITSEFGPVSPYAQRSVAGGTWVYGSYTSWSWNGPIKTCYSKYYHRSYTHSASVKLGSKRAYRSARAGRTAKARVKGSVGSTCYAYWRR